MKFDKNNKKFEFSSEELSTEINSAKEELRAVKVKINDLLSERGKIENKLKRLEGLNQLINN